MSSPGIDMGPSLIQTHPYLVLRPFVLRLFALKSLVKFTPLLNLRSLIFGFKALLLVCLHFFFFFICEYHFHLLPLFEERT